MVLALPSCRLVVGFGAKLRLNQRSLAAKPLYISRRTAIGSIAAQGDFDGRGLRLMACYHRAQPDNEMRYYEHI